jgi:hypothetical protein
MRGIDSHLFFSLNLHDLAVVDDDFDGAIPNAFDGFKECGPNIRTGFMGMYVHIFHSRLRTLHYRMMTCLPLFQYQKNEKFG